MVTVKKEQIQGIDDLNISMTLEDDNLVTVFDVPSKLKPMALFIRAPFLLETTDQNEAEAALARDGSAAYAASLVATLLVKAYSPSHVYIQGQNFVAWDQQYLERHAQQILRGINRDLTSVVTDQSLLRKAKRRVGPRTEPYKKQFVPFSSDIYCDLRKLIGEHVDSVFRGPPVMDSFIGYWNRKHTKCGINPDGLESKVGVQFSSFQRHMILDMLAYAKAWEAYVSLGSAEPDTLRERAGSREEYFTLARAGKDPLLEDLTTAIAEGDHRREREINWRRDKSLYESVTKKSLGSAIILVRPGRQLQSFRNSKQLDVSFIDVSKQGEDVMVEGMLPYGPYKSTKAMLNAVPECLESNGIKTKLGYRECAEAHPASRFTFTAPDGSNMLQKLVG